MRLVSVLCVVLFSNLNACNLCRACKASAVAEAVSVGIFELGAAVYYVCAFLYVRRGDECGAVSTLGVEGDKEVILRITEEDGGICILLVKATLHGILISGIRSIYGNVSECHEITACGNDGRGSDNGLAFINGRIKKHRAAGNEEEFGAVNSGKGSVGNYVAFTHLDELCADAFGKFIVVVEAFL